MGLWPLYRRAHISLTITPWDIPVLAARTRSSAALGIWESAPAVRGEARIVLLAALGVTGAGPVAGLRGELPTLVAGRLPNEVCRTTSTAGRGRMESIARDRV